MRIMQYLAGLTVALLLSACATSTTEPVREATRPATTRPVSNIPPDLATPLVDLDREQVSNLNAPASNIWSRIRRGFAMPDLESDLVEDRTQWYAKRPDYMERMVGRSSRYLYHIVEELERRNMPTELALLPFIESAFNPQAVSSAKAAGMWQFIPSTGKSFNLQQNMFRDERRDVLASTGAALDYLSKLYGMFGDWQLALAAYNWGEGSVARAIARNESRGLPGDYLSLNMPNETRYYVPKLQAVKNIIANPERYGVVLPDIPDHPYFVTVTTSRDIDVALAAKLAGLPLEEFKALNPSFNHPVIIGASRPQILLPYDNAETFQYNLNTFRGGLSSWTAVTVNSRERVEALAARLNLDAETIREINRIPRGMRLKAGSTVVVPKSDRTQGDISATIAESGTMAVEPDVPDARRVVVKARKRDTVAGLAKRYGVTAGQVRQWNKLSGNRLDAGESVVLMLPVRSAVARRAAEADRDEPVARGKARTTAKAEARSRSGKAVEKRSARREVVATPHNARAGKMAVKKASPVKASASKTSRR
ncbi:transglycosylase SLT domain-containing protein [Imbroritus primus]|uniref:transglycosylase SLT domain-containing protein n=1 Tax=Imbroritus primus TaxID=3058603 RepID=UPI003D1614AF